MTFLEKIPQSTSHLFQPLVAEHGFELSNRIVLAPCTRNRAMPDLATTHGAIEHYTSRADAGLLITEGTLITSGIQGFIDTPGIFLDSHVRAWAKVTDAVHRRGGRIMLQLWHPGRMAHSHFAGRSPQAPSAVLDPGPRRASGTAKLFHEMPVAFTEIEVARVLAAYEAAAINAMRAGFDGVEIHGANGYLPEQFWRQHTNRRNDGWGGSVEKRARFVTELCGRLVALLGPGKVGLRISPAAYYSEMIFTEGDNETLDYILASLARIPLAYLHAGIVEDKAYDYLGTTSTEYLRQRWQGILIGNGGYSPTTADLRIANGAFDLIAFGKLFLANADLVSKLATGIELHPYERSVLDSFK